MSQRMKYTDLKNVFECFEQNKPFKEDFNLKIILQDFGHQYSPPPLEFPGTYMHNGCIPS